MSVPGGWAGAPDRKVWKARWPAGGKGEAKKQAGSDKVYLITDRLPGEQGEAVGRRWPFREGKENGGALGTRLSWTRGKGLATGLPSPPHPSQPPPPPRTLWHPSLRSTVWWGIWTWRMPLSFSVWMRSLHGSQVSASPQEAC